METQHIEASSQEHILKAFRKLLSEYRQSTSKIRTKQETADREVDKQIVEIASNDTTLAASCVMENESGDIILKLVNAGSEPKTMSIDLSQFGNIEPDAEKILLSGNADDENTFEDPQKVIPVEGIVKITKRFEYNAPAMSLTVIRMKQENAKMSAEN